MEEEEEEEEDLHYSSSIMTGEHSSSSSLVLVLSTALEGVSLLRLECCRLCTRTATQDVVYHELPGEDLGELARCCLSLYGWSQSCRSLALKPGRDVGCRYCWRRQNMVSGR